MSPRFVSNSELGYGVEEIIQATYGVEFAGDSIYFSPGRGEPPQGIGVGENPDLSPDIGNYTRKTYYEIKPFNPKGYSEGKSQMKKYRESLQGEGWVGEGTWKAPPFIGGPVAVGGRNIIYFNDFTGIIFYTDQLNNYQLIAELASVPKSERTSRLRKLREGDLVGAVGLVPGVAFRAVTVQSATAQLVAEVQQRVALTKGLY